MSPGDIRDIHGPISIPYWWLPLAWGGAAVAAVALAYVLYRVVRRRRLDRVKDAAEIALEMIERARGLLATGTSAEFSAAVSDAVRTYIETRFGLRAAHRTTEEFLRDLVAGSDGPIVGYRATLEDFLSACDLAKFARLAFAHEQATAIVDCARRFVVATATPPHRERSTATGAPPQGAPTEVAA